MDPLILPRLQFAPTIGHHIRRPAFAISVVPRVLSRLPLSRLSRIRRSPRRRAEEKDVPPRPWRLPARVGPALVLAAALAACTTATPRLAPPAPATLAAVHGLAPHTCNPTTASVLDALGVPPAAVRSIYYERPPIGNSHGIVERATPPGCGWPTSPATW